LHNRTLPPCPSLNGGEYILLEDVRDFVKGLIIGLVELSFDFLKDLKDSKDFKDL
jgi:hypothetical protein